MSPLWFMKKSLFNTGDLINNESTLTVQYRRLDKQNFETKSLFNTGDLINNDFVHFDKQFHFDSWKKSLFNTGDLINNESTLIL